MKIEDLYTLEAHEAGAELRLISPITNKPTDFYLTIVGVDSNRWRDAELDGKRKIMAMSKAEQGDKKAHRAIVADVLSQAVIGWKGFDKKEFDREFVKDVFINSPLIAEQVDEFIGKRANFIKG
jgi:hypothetical protein